MKHKTIKQLSDALAPAIKTLNYYNEKMNELEMIFNFKNASYTAQYEEGLFTKYEYNFYIKLNEKEYQKSQEKLAKECRKMIAQGR